MFFLGILGWRCFFGGRFFNFYSFRGRGVVVSLYYREGSTGLEGRRVVISRWLS